MSLPALPMTADTRSITERVNVLIRDYNTLLGVPAGCIMPYAGATVPDGWLLCHGQAVSRSTYADLFAAIGTAYGAGDGSTSFNLPDLRGRVAAGRDNMGGSAANRLTSGGSGINGATLGAAGGAESHTLTAAQMPAHNHGVTDSGHSHGYSDPGHSHGYATGANLAPGINARAASGDGTSMGAPFTNGSGVGIVIQNSSTGISIQNAGSNGAHNNTQPTFVLNYVIAT